MSTPTNGAAYEARVMVEVVKNGVPRRVHVWQQEGQTMVSFPLDLGEEEAVAIVARGMAMLKPLDVRALFREAGTNKRRRFIETEE